MKLIGLIGAAGAGKDTLASALIQRGWRRIAFGDPLKDFFSPFTKGEISADELEARILSQGHDGPEAARIHSGAAHTAATRAFIAQHAAPYEWRGQRVDSRTEDRALKPLVRPILEYGGDLINPLITRLHFERIDELLSQGEHIINPRVGRPHEAVMTRERGGVNLLIDRPDQPPASAWEAQIITALTEAQLIDARVVNGQDFAQWQLQCARVARAIERGASAAEVAQA